MDDFDPLVDEQVAPDTSVRRDLATGDPLIIPRGGTEEIPYTRASSLTDYLTEEPYNLRMWYTRYGLQGVARHPDLAARIAAVRYSTGPLTGCTPDENRRAAAEIDAVFREAQERMGINEAANLGTAGHSLTEPGNQGQAAPPLEPVVAGHQRVTAGLERVASEVFVVNDALRAGGTFDSAYIDEVNYPGYVIIGDTKTGKNYHQAQFEIQLAVYQGGEVYLSDGGRLTFEEYFGLPVHPHVAYVVHTSITGKPQPRIVKLDLARGRRWAQVATMVRDSRREMDKVGIGEKVDHVGLAREVLRRRLDDVETVEQGRALYARFKHVWTDADTAAVKGRLA